MRIVTRLVILLGLLAAVTAQVWAQDAASCGISSMPDATRKRGVVEFSGTPEELALPMETQFGVHAGAALYGWRARSRVYKWYGQLKFLERELDEDPAARTRAEWLAELERIENHVHRVATPLAFTNLLYTLREHIALVQAKVLKKTGENPPAAG